MKEKKQQTAIPKTGDIVWVPMDDGNIRYGAMLSNKNIIIGNGHQLLLGETTQPNLITEKNSISKGEIDTLKAFAKNEERIINIDKEIERLQKERQELCNNKTKLKHDMFEYRTERKNKEKEDIQKKKYSGIEKNAGITYQEAKNKIIDAIIVGAGLKVIHSEVAPYTTGYAIVKEAKNSNKRDYVASYTGEVHGYVDLFNQLSEQAFYGLLKKGWVKQDFEELFKESDKAWGDLPKEYTPNKYYAQNRGELHVANGYETDGFNDIVMGRCHGVYSTWTTTSQNKLSETLIMLKGYCPDVYFSRNKWDIDGKNMTGIMPFVEQIYKRHGIDSDLSNLEEWSRRNPSRCGVDNPCYCQAYDDMEEDMEK